MIASGQKTEEYRVINDYWLHRLCFTRVQDGCSHCKKTKDCQEPCRKCYDKSSQDWMPFPYDYVKFYRGYTSTCMTFSADNIRIGIGNPEWGAPAHEVFIIDLGEKVTLASDHKCIVCGKQAVSFWPCIDPDIPAYPYCSQCLDKERHKAMIELMKHSPVPLDPSHD